MEEKPLLRHPISRRGALAAGIGAAVGAVSLGPSTPAVATPRPTDDGDLIALTHVTVIDATGAPPRPDMTVLVRGGRIATLGRSSEVPVPVGTRTVDLAGKFVIPGLCDMHVHSLFPEGILPQLYIATGVTTVREMMGLPWVHQWRDQIETGDLIGPRWVIGSHILDGKPSIWSGNDAGLYEEIISARQAHNAVRQAKLDGADFIKIYSRLNRQSLHAIANEARRERIPFAGHMPDIVPIIEAARAGQRSFEHLFPALLGASGSEAEVRRMLAAITLAGDGNGHRDWFQGIHAAEWLAANTYNPRRAADVYAQLKREQVAVTPTMIMHRTTDLPDDIVPDHERLKYLPPGTLETWKLQLESTFVNGRTPQKSAQYRVLFQHRLRVLNEMHRAGVQILVGTDASGAPFGYPGFAVHDELALLVSAGFTPMEALQAATREPARYLGLQHSLGTVRQGHLADLVILDANPLHDIRNTQRIHALMLRGRFVSSTERQRMLADIEAVARTTSTMSATTGCCG
ncbi:amidohydrolase family protein [Dactylosporangium fulvum]|uniref:Amidohydrolase family protein n=1 Tax=Dactylosporangium fulvum TaxID=53359 RepID=A0ABY5VWJ2_9ACTN|nr:amidohydrolase family protein [Dactylosporangium fulvum]UWP82098.1 amidohydrolase family protein [Dactylosporangium fulvum]